MKFDSSINFHSLNIDSTQSILTMLSGHYQLFPCRVDTWQHETWVINWCALKIVGLHSMLSQWKTMFQFYSMKSIVEVRTWRFYIFHGLAVDPMCIDTTYSIYCSIYQGNIKQQRIVSTLSWCRYHWRGRGEREGGKFVMHAPFIYQGLRKIRKQISHFLVVTIMTI